MNSGSSNYYPETRDPVRSRYDIKLSEVRDKRTWISIMRFCLFIDTKYEYGFK